MFALLIMAGSVKVAEFDRMRAAERVQPDVLHEPLVEWKKCCFGSTLLYKEVLGGRY